MAEEFEPGGLVYTPRRRDSSDPGPAWGAAGTPVTSREALIAQGRRSLQRLRANPGSALRQRAQEGSQTVERPEPTAAHAHDKANGPRGELSAAVQLTNGASLGAGAWPAPALNGGDSRVVLDGGGSAVQSGRDEAKAAVLHEALQALTKRNDELELEAARLRRQRDAAEAQPELVESLRAALDAVSSEHDSLLNKYQAVLTANDELLEAQVASAAELEVTRAALRTASEQLAAARAELAALKAGEQSGTASCSGTLLLNGYSNGGSSCLNGHADTRPSSPAAILQRWQSFTRPGEGSPASAGGLAAAAHGAGPPAGAEAHKDSKGSDGVESGGGGVSAPLGRHTGAHLDQSAPASGASAGEQEVEGASEQQQEQLRRRQTDLDEQACASPCTPPTPPTSARGLGSPLDAPAAAAAGAPHQPPPAAPPALHAPPVACSLMGHESGAFPSSAFLPVAVSSAPLADAHSIRPERASASEPHRAAAAAGADDDVARLERLIQVIMSNVNKEANASMAQAASEARAQLQLVGMGGASAGWVPIDLGQPILPARLSRRLESERAARERPGFFARLFGADDSFDADDRRPLPATQSHADATLASGVGATHRARTDSGAAAAELVPASGVHGVRHQHGGGSTASRPSSSAFTMHV